MEVQTVKSPGGIEAWLVEDYAEPMFALRFAFRGGSSQDPAGKDGLANFVTLLLKQGGGDLTAVEFEQQLENLAVEVRYNLEFDAISGAIDAISEARNDVAELVGLALARPRFDENTLDRLRRRFRSFHGGEARRPHLVAEMQWNAVAFSGHLYARRSAGDEASINEITAADLKTYHRRVFAKSGLKVVAVGDITAAELGELLDRLFGDLPADGDLADVPIATPVTGGRLRVAEMELPQSTVAFGLGTVNYDSPDYITAQLLNHMLGGGGQQSRLAGELRQKRGLAFTVATWLERRRQGVVLRGSLSTRNDTVAESLEIVREELQQMAAGNLSEAELDDAKSYLIRYQPIAFSSPSKVADQLLTHAMDGFGPGFSEERNAMIAAVSLQDLKRVAGYMLDPENLIVSIAGTPALQPRRTE